MKVLLTGANGYVGGGLIKYLPQNNYSIVPVGFGVDNKLSDIYNLDLTDFSATSSYIKENKPDVILHLAGNKDVTRCESDNVLSKRINFEASENLIKECRLQKIRLIYLSTDYVFGGIGAPFNELSVPSPATQYGKDKLATENIIKSALVDYAICRTAGIFGLRNDFVDTVIKQVKEGKEFRAYVNLKNSPTFIKDLSRMLDVIIKEEKRGVFHCSGSESLSRYSFAVKVVSAFNLNKSLVIPDSIDLSHDPRPSDLSMDSSKTYKDLNYYPQEIDEILRKNYSIWENDYL